MSRFLRRHRRAIAFALAFLGVLVGLASVKQRPPSWEALVLAGDLPAGKVLAGEDLRPAALPADARPASAVTDPSAAVGRVLAGPASAGEVLTENRLVGPGLLAGSAGQVALPVRLEDPAEAAYLRAGDLVDVLAASRATNLGADESAAPVAARTVARAVRVLAVPGAAGAAASGLLAGGVGSGQGTVVLVAVPTGTAAEIAGAAVNARLSVVMRA